MSKGAGADPYVFGADAERVRTDGGVIGGFGLSHNMAAIQVTFDDNHLRVRSPLIGPDVAIDREAVSVVYRGWWTGIRFIPVSNGADIATTRIRGVRLSGFGGATIIAATLQRRGWPVKRVNLIAELKISLKAARRWLTRPPVSNGSAGSQRNTRPPLF